MCIYKSREVFVEISLKTVLDVVPQDLDVVIAVRSRLLVKDAQAVHHLMLDCARVETRARQIHLIFVIFWWCW